MEQQRPEPGHEGGEEHAHNADEPVAEGVALASPQETVAATPRIYLADNAAALKGVDWGRWVDATAEPEELRAVRDELLTMSPFAGASVSIHDAADFQGLNIDHNEDLDTVSRVARGIASHGRAFVAYLDAWGADQETVDRFSDYYLGSWPTLAAWAESVVEEQGWARQLTEHLDPRLLPHIHIDYERLGRELSYETHIVEDHAWAQIHVFRLQA